MRRRLRTVSGTVTDLGHLPGPLHNRLSQGECPLRALQSDRNVGIDSRELDEWIERFSRLGGEPGQER